MFCFVSFISTVLILGTDDPIKEDLDKARAIYQEKTEAASNKLLKAFDKQLERADGKAAETIRSQKQAFQNNKDSLPAAPQLQGDSGAYNTEIAYTKLQFKKALEKARDDYKKARKTDEANILSKEITSLADKKAKPKPSGRTNSTGPGARDSLQADTQWEGFRQMGSGADPWSLKVTERTGNEIKGEIIVGKEGTRAYLFKGKIDSRNWIVLETEQKGNFHQRFEGEITGQEIGGKMFGTSAAGNYVEGRVNLIMKK